MSPHAQRATPPHPPRMSPFAVRVARHRPARAAPIAGGETYRSVQWQGRETRPQQGRRVLTVVRGSPDPALASACNSEPTSLGSARFERFDLERIIEVGVAAAEPEGEVAEEVGGDEEGAPAFILADVD
jgi:hypothetical protein